MQGLAEVFALTPQSVLFLPQGADLFGQGVLSQHILYVFCVVAETSSSLRDGATSLVGAFGAPVHFKRWGAGATAIFRGPALAAAVPRAHAADVPLALALADMAR